MTALVLIDCDAADCMEQIESGSIALSEARKMARAAGWRTSYRGPDFCPEHARTERP